MFIFLLLLKNEHQKRNRISVFYEILYLCPLVFQEHEQDESCIHGGCGSSWQEGDQSADLLQDYNWDDNTISIIVITSVRSEFFQVRSS